MAVSWHRLEEAPGRGTLDRKLLHPFTAVAGKGYDALAALNGVAGKEKTAAKGGWGLAEGKALYRKQEPLQRTFCSFQPDHPCRRSSVLPGVFRVFC